MKQDRSIQPGIGDITARSTRQFPWSCPCCSCGQFRRWMELPNIYHGSHISVATEGFSPCKYIYRLRGFDVTRYSCADSVSFPRPNILSTRWSNDIFLWMLYDPIARQRRLASCSNIHFQLRNKFLTWDWLILFCALLSLYLSLYHLAFVRKKICDRPRCP